MDSLTGDAPIPLATFVADMCGPHEDDVASGGKRHQRNTNTGCPSQSNPQVDVNALPPGMVAYRMIGGKMTRVSPASSSSTSSSPMPVPAVVSSLPPNTTVITTAGGMPTAIYTAPSSPAAPGAFTQLAQGADVEGIGIAEFDMGGSNSADATAAASPNPAALKTVHVRIRSHQRPLILVLSSRTGVQWQLDPAWGAHLVAVLLSGPNGSSVQGQGNVPVSIIGSAYSYAVGSPGYAALQSEVFNSTGKRIQLLQSGGPNTDFSIY
ncbi:MAG TPA: hypothetical protein VGH91_05555 [Gammaproteobacteria bacterium]